MDGRIDNRDELNAAFGAILSPDTDAKLTLRAYQRRGEESPRPILGDFAYPFHDRRLTDLALALPPDQLQRGDQSKFILRQAMKGLVPDPVLQRRDKAEFSAVCAQLYESDTIARFFHSSRIAEQGWIDQARVTAMYREFMETWNQGQKDCLPHVWPLSMYLGIELWFRAAFP